MITMKESPYDLIATLLNCNIEVSEFEFKSCYYIHFLIGWLAGW